MKKYKSLLDIVLLLGLSTIVLLAVAPKKFVMPSSLQMLILAIVLGLIASFLVLLWREQPNDEREMQNQALASRLAYIVGSLVLIIALITQSLGHDLDPIIPITLLTMISTKIIVQRNKDDK
jgi:NADH:ubiquinone oxidoreductase subunit 2 (subunit N)